MDEILGIIAALVFLYYFLDILHFVVTHWVWFAGILIPLLILGAIFFPNSGPSGPSNNIDLPINKD